jgi:uncharacterized membrane protein
MMRLWRILRARARLFAAVAIGLIAVPLVPAQLGPITKSVLCWDIGVLAYLILAAQLFLTERPEQMPAHAKRQEEGEWTIFGITLAVVTFSFIAIIGEFSLAKAAKPGVQALHVALVCTTLLLSWLMTHTSFCFRYAHEFYTKPDDDGDVDGGLAFPNEKLPDYLDFFYFSLVLGMTFQVSDVQITSRKFRRLASVHGLLSFLFNTIILALTINIIAGML